jgi:general secretion pathway protein D
MHKTTHRTAAAVALAALGLSGCEHMGPDPAKKMQLPANLAIERAKNIEALPMQTEPLAATPPRPPEYYPATGSLVGSAGRAEVATSTAAGPAGKGGGRKEGKYTLNFDDADLSEVAKTILDETLKINYVLSPKVTGKVTLQTTRPLAEDELIPTLEMLLRMNGAVLIRDHDMYRIVPDATALVDAPGPHLGGASQAGMPPGYQLRVVPLRYAGVQEMQKVIEPLMPPKAVVRADVPRNMLMLAGTPEELEGVLETIRLFDVDFMRGMSVGVFPLKNVEPATVAEELDKVLGDTNKGPLAGMVRIMPIERLNAILVVTPQPRYLDEVETWIERLDRYTTNRAGGIHVYRVQNVDAMELANTLSNIFGTGGGGGRGRPSLSPGSQGSQIGGGGSYGSGGGGGAFGSSGGSGGGGLTSSSGDMDSGSSLNGGSGSSSGFGSSGSMGGGGMGSSGGGMGSSSGSMGSSSGLGGSSGSSTSGGRGSFGGGSGGGGFGGGIGRGSSGGGQRGRGSMATDLGNVRIVADPSNNALIITARAQDYKEIEAIIKDLDVLPLQVLIDATIAEVLLTDNLKYGIKWYFQEGSQAQSLLGSLTESTAANALADIGKSYAFQYSVVAAGKDVRILLSAQADKNKINVLSSPSLMVLNNQEASIKVGDQVPILTGQYGNFTGSGSTGGIINNNPVYSSYNSVQYRDTGVLLNIKPRVNAGGLVIMDIAQAVDDVKQQTSGNIDSPTITQRQIKSSVAVANGETLVLGGLIKENATNTRSGIPLLYDLPLIGDLFGQTTKKIDRTELVILLTPRVINSQIKGREITNEFRRKLSGLYESGPIGGLAPPAGR